MNIVVNVSDDTISYMLLYGTDGKETQFINPTAKVGNTVKPVIKGHFIKRNFVLNGNILRSRGYHSVP
jgi:hypothetical protein